ncbi:MAG: hypothetical protein GX346_00045 [Clostridiales bacterium]|nr:hypothetical protein [Clostridiales bacterium]
MGIMESILTALFTWIVVFAVLIVLYFLIKIFSAVLMKFTNNHERK